MSWQTGFYHYWPTLTKSKIPTVLEKLYHVPVHFLWRQVKKSHILYEKLYMKLYVNDEKTFVGYWGHDHDTLWEE